jgi:hypothetical protein
VPALTPASAARTAAENAVTSALPPAPGGLMPYQSPPLFKSFSGVAQVYSTTAPSPQPLRASAPIVSAM